MKELEKYSLSDLHIIEAHFHKKLSHRPESPIGLSPRGDEYINYLKERDKWLNDNNFILSNIIKIEDEIEKRFNNIEEELNNA